MFRSALIVVGVLVCSVFFTDRAGAQWSPSGDIDGFMLIERGAEERRLGGGMLFDLYQPFGVFRLGFSVGMGALTSTNEDENRIFAPLGVTLGLGTNKGIVGVAGVLRGGMWSGATNIGLRAGGWIGAGVSIDVKLDDVLRLAAGLEYWMLFSEERRDLFVPTIALRWTPAELDS